MSEIITNEQVYDTLALVLGMCKWAEESPKDRHRMMDSLRELDQRCIITAMDWAREAKEKGG